MDVTAMPKGRQMLADLLRGYNREAVAGMVGAPVDMATQLANLLIAGGGYAAHKAGLINQPPDLIDNARAVGSSDWIYNRLPAQPALTGSTAENVGRMAGSVLSPPVLMQAAPTTARMLAKALQEKAPGIIDRYVEGIGGRMPLIVYHGTPHKFDKFDSSKIGTGEGQQVYGHGLYLAESPDVARTYRTPEATYQRSAGHMSPKEEFAFDLFSQGRGEEDVFSAMFQKYGKHATTNAEMDAIDAAFKSARNKALSGHLYTVDLPDPMIARMLDWDKPLSQQAPGVRKAIDDIAQSEEMYRGKYAPRLLDKRTTAGDVVGIFGDAFGGPDVASNYLRGAGIPGIGYLDGGSRGAGAGTTNFVVFPGEENALRILRRE